MSALMIWWLLALATDITIDEGEAGTEEKTLSLMLVFEGPLKEQQEI